MFLKQLSSLKSILRPVIDYTIPVLQGLISQCLAGKPQDTGDGRGFGECLYVAPYHGLMLVLFGTGVFPVGFPVIDAKVHGNDVLIG